MPRIKLTKPSFANLTGQLPGKNFRGVNFVDGISDEIPLAVVDKIAAQIGGLLVDEAGEVLDRAGSLYRKTTIVPTPTIPRSESQFPQTGAADPEFIAQLETIRASIDDQVITINTAVASVVTSEGKAKASETAAAASAGNAKTSETNAKNSEVAAKASEVAAAKSAADAAASAGTPAA